MVKPKWAILSRGWLILGSSHMKPDLRYLETAGRWPSATHVPPLAGSASLIPPGTSPKAPAAPACVPLQRMQHIINVCARAASFITEQRPPGGHYSVFNMNISFCMFRPSREEISSFSCAACLVHSETLTKNFLSSENLYYSIIHFLIGFFK